MSHTPNYYLNDLGLRDVPALYQLARHPAFFYAYINENRQPVWLGVARFIVLALRLRLRRPRHWFKALRSADHRLLGCVVLLDMGVLTRGVAEIAYFTAVPARGQGLTKRAVLSVVRWAQARYGLHGLYASVDPDNPASTAILQSLGLSPTKFIPAEQSVFTDRHGQPRPCWVMQTTPQSLQAALTAPYTAMPVLQGRERPDAEIDKTV